MTHRAPSPNANWRSRRVRPPGVPGIPWMSFILTLCRFSGLPSVSGGTSTGCTAGRLTLISAVEAPRDHSLNAPMVEYDLSNSEPRIPDLGRDDRQEPTSATRGRRRRRARTLGRKSDNLLGEHSDSSAGPEVSAPGNDFGHHRLLQTRGRRRSRADRFNGFFRSTTPF